MNADNESAKSIVGAASDKINMFFQRYSIIYQVISISNRPIGFLNENLN